MPNWVIVNKYGQLIHLIFELLAYTIGFRYFIYLRRKNSDTISDDNRTILLIAAAIGATLFSRIIGALDEGIAFELSINSLVQIYQSKTILGGLLGGMLSVEITKKIIGIQQSSGDLMTYPILLSMMIGRLGCFLSGLNDGTEGVATSLPWGIDFGDKVQRHPTNLYEILFLVILWVIIPSLEKKYMLKDGAKFKLFLSSYCLFRLMIEFIKPTPTLLIGLTAIHWTSILGLIYYFKIILNPFHSLIISKKNG